MVILSEQVIIEGIIIAIVVILIWTAGEMVIGLSGWINWRRKADKEKRKNKEGLRPIALGSKKWMKEFFLALMTLLALEFFVQLEGPGVKIIDGILLAVGFLLLIYAFLIPTPDEYDKEHQEVESSQGKSEE